MKIKSIISFLMAYWLLLLLSSTVLASPCPPPDCGDCYTWDPNIEECVWDCVDCQVCEDCNCVKDPNVECDHDTDCGDPNCWDCVDCNCVCDVNITSVVSSADYACIDCNVTFTANVTGSCSCVDWSGGGDPASQDGGCTFTTKWDTPGVKTVTATPDCGSSKSKEVAIIAGAIESLDNCGDPYGKYLLLANPASSSPTEQYRAKPGQPSGTTYKWEISDGNDKAHIVGPNTVSTVTLKADEEGDFTLKLTYTKSGTNCIIDSSLDIETYIKP